MTAIKILLTNGILFLFPAVLGSLWDYFCMGKKEKSGWKEYVTDGALVAGALFGVLSFAGVSKGWTLERYGTLAFLGVLLLFFIWAAVLGLWRPYRVWLKGCLAGLKADIGRDKQWKLVSVAAYLAVAFYYVVGPKYMPAEYSLPEQVLSLVESGVLSPGMSFPVVGSACLCEWTGLGVMDVVFGVLPFQVLLLVFCVMWRLGEVMFEDSKSHASFLLLGFAFLVLFGNEAFMNPVYLLLHYPYDGMTFVVFVVLMQVLLIFLSGKRRRNLAVLAVNAFVFGGVKKGGGLFLGLLILMCLWTAIWKIAKRRRHK